ncbi:MAG: RNase adapter protein RapZ [Eubacteriales bacterium]|nr:RNase adapter protein RapZ [Eubacteriales bacterium]MDN5363541.1 RNase adapter protein RapZ [Eubacteriales bacterium]
MSDLQLVIVTGLSGAGKTQAVRCLEDLGFFCVDNLPPTLIPKFAELVSQSGGKIKKIALVIDIRGGEFFDSVPEILEQLSREGIKYEILFLEASDETLVRRFKELRRRHPLNPEGSVLECIREERKRLEELRGKANKIIDTTDLSPQQLKEEIFNLYGEGQEKNVITITVMSFGFKYGLPLDADLVIDVRFLPNPYYIKEMRNLTGNDPLVTKYVMDSEVTQGFLAKFNDLMTFLLPHYIKEGKTSLVIAIGCTGGQHRSVVLANEIGKKLAELNYRVKVKHRDEKRVLGGRE